MLPSAVSSHLPHSENVEEEHRRINFALSTVFSGRAPPISPAFADVDSILSSREAADRYLTSFQRGTLAWIICDRVLLDTSNKSDGVIQSRFFAAQTLHFKCREEAFIRQIPSTSLPSLRDSLVTNITTYYTLGGHRPLVTRLCMALSCLAVQMRWNSIINDILETVYRPRPELAPVVIELFSILPEECFSNRLYVSEENMKYDIRHSLSDCCESVIGFLAHVFEGNGGGKLDVILCLTSWLKCVNVSPYLIERSIFLDVLFEVIIDGSDDDLFEAGVDGIVEILRMYGSCATANQGLVKRMIPLVMNLGVQPFRKAVESEDQDILRGFCRIFTEMGESYLDLIMSKVEMNQGALVELVLLCCEIPDTEIANITLNFWYNFVNALEALEPYRFRQERIDLYTPLLLRLLNICTVLLRFPPNVNDLQPDMLDDIIRDRLYVSDTIQDLCRLLGGDIVLTNLGRRLEEEYRLYSSGSNTNKEENWQGYESCLNAISSISKYVSGDENVFIPTIMGLLSNRALPQEVTFMRNTAYTVIGSYAYWLSSHSNYLQPLMSYLSEGFSIEDSASVSAVAIRQLCEDCYKQPLCEPVLQLYDQIVQDKLENKHNASFKTDLKDDNEVLEGICKAVSSQFQTNPEMAQPCLERLAAPIGNRLAQLAAPENATTTPNQIITEIERLAVIVRYLTLPSSDPNQTGDTFILEIMKQSWTLLDAASLKFPHDGTLAEKMSRLHKHALRKCGSECYKPLLDPLLFQIVRNFAQAYQSSYLYLASICVTEYGRQPECKMKLFEMLSQLSTAIFSLFKTPNDFIVYPDVVEEFFYLVGRFMDYCPQPLVLSPLLQSILQCASAGMHLQHMDANKGTLSFLESTLSYGHDIILYGGEKSSRVYDHRLEQGEDQVQNGEGKEQCQQALQAAILAEGPNIVSNIVRALAGELPAYHINRGSGSISGVVWKLNALCPELLMNWISAPLEAVPHSKPKKEFMDCLSQRGSRDEMNAVVRSFVRYSERSLEATAPRN